ncbi:MAG TPA: phage tail sheath subtilisin-like domain-containing protein [Albitalea sp.]
MPVAYATPGAYREDVFIRPAVPLPTGVPGFVGFGRATGGAGEREAVLLHRPEEMAGRFEPDIAGFLADVVAGFFANGGVRCYLAGAASEGDGERALEKAIDKLAPLGDLDLVAVPDAMTLPQEAAQRVQGAAIAHCAALGNRFAILDAPRETDPAAIARPLASWRTYGAALANAALYYPWVKVMAGEAGGGRPVPPCGHVAGIFARCDERAGVSKAPANEELQAVLDLEFPVDGVLQGRLNPLGINCLRAFPGRGLRVWGARTLSAEPSWRYVNTRRVYLTLARWIERNLAWAAYEPNTPSLWFRIQRELGAYLAALWQAGALKGASPAEAFYVKCDAETNPPGEREQGRVATEVGLATALPAEFVVVRIVHREGASRLS